MTFDQTSPRVLRAGCCAALLLLSGCADADTQNFTKAADNAVQANEAFHRSHRYLEAWLTQRDTETGLIPKAIGVDEKIWNAKDVAADNYPFMVLTAAMTDRVAYSGAVLDMLRAETTLTSRLRRLPDTFSIDDRDFADAQPDIERIIFGSAEYMKDGLLPVTEVLGQTPWSDRLIEILDDVWEEAPIQTSFGKIPTGGQEVHGDMLQVLPRIYWMTGDERYLDYAIRLGDLYLLDNYFYANHPPVIRLRDHGNEIISGLTELYATVHVARPDKYREYKAPLYALLDRIWETGTNRHGLFYEWLDLETGEHGDTLTDNWGYNLNAYYIVSLVDNHESYRERVRVTLLNLDRHYRNYPWPANEHDGYADAIESALYLIAWEPVASAAAWIDSQIQILWSMQQEDGFVAGNYLDGNFARTSLIYGLWKTQGITMQPWREDVRLGAVYKNEQLYVSVAADSDWQGALIFDTPRHQTMMHMPMNYPRINAFPEWYTVTGDQRYEVMILNEESSLSVTGEKLVEGLPVQLKAGEELRMSMKARQ